MPTMKKGDKFPRLMTGEELAEDLRATTNRNTLSDMGRENNFTLDLNPLAGGKAKLEKEAAAWAAEREVEANLGAYIRWLIKTHPSRQKNERSK